MQDQSPSPRAIPDKLYFKIGEVADLTGLATYVLRFWETEFPRVKPRRTPSGQRLYTRADIELILKIKHLLYEKKFTIQGARRHLARRGKPSTRLLADLRRELQNLKDLID